MIPRSTFQSAFSSLIAMGEVRAELLPFLLAEPQRLVYRKGRH